MKILVFYVDKQYFNMVILFLRLRVRRELIIRRDGRAVEGTGLENRRRASVRGFESHALRQRKTQSYQGFCPYDWAFLFSQGHIGVHDFRQELRCASRSALCPAESG